MIAFLSGTVREAQQSKIVIVVAGIGYTVAVPKSYAMNVGDQVVLEIYYHYTEDQGPSLFGFLTRDEREVFACIIGCSGVGPRIGLAVLSVLSPSALVAAVLSGDVIRLSSVDGIGAKKAESIIVQLKDKVKKLVLEDVSTNQYQAATALKQLNEALSSLGYNRHEITRAIDHLKESDSLINATFDELLRASLGHLAKKAL